MELEIIPLIDLKALLLNSRQPNISEITVNGHTAKFDYKYQADEIKGVPDLPYLTESYGCQFNESDFELTIHRPEGMDVSPEQVLGTLC